MNLAARISPFPMAKLHGLLLSSAAVQVVGLAATTIVGVQLARYLGPRNYGIYGLVLSIVSILTVLAQFGLPLLATREAARARSANRQANLRTVFRWFLQRSLPVSAVVVALSLLLLSLWNPPWARDPAILVYAAAATWTLAVLAIVAGLLRGSGWNLASQIIEAAVRPALTVIALWGVYRTFGSLGVREALAVQVSVTIICILAAIAIIAQIARYMPVERYAPDRWLSVSLSFMLSAMLVALNGNYPMVVAGLFVSAVDLGVFKVALASAALLGLPTAVANISVAPLVAKLAHGDEDEALRNTIAHTTLASFGATLAGLVLLIVFGRELINLLFGARYLDAYIPLLILGLAQLVISAFGIAGSYLNLTGRERLVIKAFAMSVPIGFIVSLPLTWKFGIEGAATGNLCMVILWHWYVVVLHRREIRVPLFVLSAWKTARQPRNAPIP